MRVLFILILLASFNLAFPQSSNSSKIFTKIWTMPNYPDTVLNTPLGVEDKGSCRVYFPDSNSIFSVINGMACDKEDNLYLWEDIKTIWKFSSTGEKIFKIKASQGETEDSNKFFSKSAFAVSNDGLICLGERSGNIKYGALVIFDKNGNFQRRIKIKVMPATVTFGLDNSIYVAGFEMLYKGPIVQHYSLSGKFIGSFCGRDAISERNNKTGNAGKLYTDSAGRIYYAFFCPYRVKVFSATGDSVKTIERNIAGMKEALNVVQTNGANHKIYSSTPNFALRGVTVLDENNIATASFGNLSKNEWNIDLFDIAGKYKCSIPNSALPDSFSFQQWAHDSKGDVYFNIGTYKGFAVVKYKIDQDKLKAYK